MSRTFHHGERHIRVKGIRQDKINKRELVDALIYLMQDAEARADHETRTQAARPTAKEPTGKPFTKRRGRRAA